MSEDDSNTAATTGKPAKPKKDSPDFPLPSRYWALRQED